MDACMKGHTEQKALQQTSSQEATQTELPHEYEELGALGTGQGQALL